MALVAHPRPRTLLEVALLPRAVPEALVVLEARGAAPAVASSNRTRFLEVSLLAAER